MIKEKIYFEMKKWIYIVVFSELLTRDFIVVIAAFATIVVPGTAVVTAIAVTITTEAIFLN